MKIAILGHGTVGGGVSRILLDNPQKGLEIVAIATLHPEKDAEFYSRHQHLFTTAEEILANPEIQIVCETIGGDDIALDLTKRALQSGKHVVTANKKMVARHFIELQKIAKENNVHILFEAAVAGGIPILSALHTGLAGDNITKITGILNGTTNYMLTKMEEGISYKDILQETQELGYAEADPTDDVDGFDAAYKTCILIILAFGIWISPEDIPTVGISKIQTTDIEYAKRAGYKIKLVGHIEKKGNVLSAAVSPRLYKTNTRIAKTNGVLNAINVRGDYNTPGNFLSGEGAGRWPTACSIVSDMVNISRGKIPSYPEVTSSHLEDTEENSYFVRFNFYDRPGIIGEIGSILGKNGVSISRVDQIPALNDPIPVAIITGKVRKDQIENALSEISKLDFNERKPLAFPIAE